jgi:protein-tyrosine phosphatase
MELERVEILVVCTGNACRSPMAAVLLQHRLDERGVDARVRSAGTMPWSAGVTADATAVMGEYGLVVDGHGRRKLTSDLVGPAELVLGMTRNHVSYTVRQFPDARHRTFMVGELARLGRAAGPRRHYERVSDWAQRVSRTQRPDRGYGRSTDEVDDPAGEPIEFYRRTAALLDRSLTEIVEMLAPAP